MFLENLKRIASILCLSQYIVDQSRENIIQAVLRFLLKPSILFNASSIESLTMKNLPESVDESIDCKEVRRESTESSTSSEKTANLSSGITSENTASLKSRGTRRKIGAPQRIDQSDNDLLQSVPENLVSEPAIKCELETTTVSHRKSSTPRHRSRKRRSTPEPNEVNPSVPPPRQSHAVSEMKPVVKNGELDEPLSLVKDKNVSIPSYESRLESDEDDKPLVKFIGHPNDDQLKVLISKVMKESKLEELTMKQLIKVVFSTYPHFDLAYRKEFIKSVARQILSQMDQQRCSVSTTVFTY